MRAECVIPLQDVERIQLYINKSVRTLAEVKALTGADMALVGVPAPWKLNYICYVCLLRGDQPERLIYVPVGSLETYQTATNWSTCVGKMQEELT